MNAFELKKKYIVDSPPAHFNTLLMTRRGEIAKENVREKNTEMDGEKGERKAIFCCL